jgi:anthranilate synthase component 1
MSDEKVNALTARSLPTGPGVQSDAASSGPGAEIFPEEDRFAKVYDHGTAQVIWTRLIADLETPVSAYLKLGDRRPMSFLLESIEGGSARGRYSVIGFAPDVVWQAVGEMASLNRTPMADAGAFVADDAPTLQSLRNFLAESAIVLPEALPPMAAGIFGFMGYDTVRLIEKLPEMTPDTCGVPDAILIRPTLMLIFDNVKDEMILVTPVRPSAGINAADAYAAALARIHGAMQSLDAPLPHGSSATTESLSLPEPQSNTTAADYLAMVAKAKDYIKAGDIFQVVLSQRFSAPFELPSFALYRSLRRLNPSPFLFHLDFGTFQLVGSSPEILVRVREGEVTIRPIAGTARRGVNDAEDKALAAALLADPKERSEHLMLLDLGRNDIGRVSTTGSVTVTDQFVIERYSHVMHIVSGVNGELAPGKDAFDLFAAAFPAGTLVGAPKVRAMEIIDELEPVRRGFYGGTVGYFGHGGDMDHAITIRTMVFRGDTYSYQAGAGLVADSVPQTEYEEVLAKSAIVRRALALAEEGL